MPVPYITNRWQAVYLDFGPGLDDIHAPGLPPVLTVRIVRDNVASSNSTQSAPLQPYPLVEYLPAWLATPELLASMCWRMDQANASGPPGSPEALRRMKRWLTLLDALRGLFERLRGKCEDHYNRYELAGGPPPLPTPPTLPVVRNSRGLVWHSVWDGEALGLGGVWGGVGGVASSPVPVNGESQSLVLSAEQPASRPGPLASTSDRAIRAEGGGVVLVESSGNSDAGLRAGGESGSVVLEVGLEPTQTQVDKSKLNSKPKSKRKTRQENLLF